MQFWHISSFNFFFIFSRLVNVSHDIVFEPAFPSNKGSIRILGEEIQMAFLGSEFENREKSQVKLHFFATSGINYLMNGRREKLL